MAEYCRGTHAVFDIKYHLVWITKYRYKILRGRVAERGRDLLRQICQAREVVIKRGAIPEGSVVAQAAGRVSETTKAVLGPALVGAGVFLRECGRGGRGNHPEVYREPEMG